MTHNTKILNRLYKDIQTRQLKSADVIHKAELPDLRSHHIGMFSAYSEILNLIDQELSKLEEDKEK